MTGNNPIDFSACRSKGGGAEGFGPPSRFSRTKYITVCVRKFKFHRVIDMMTGKNPIDLSVCRSKGGMMGGQVPLPGFHAFSTEPYALGCLNFTG